MKLSDAVRGRKVIYTPFNSCEPSQKEEGIISSINDKYVFVKFKADWINGVACDPEDLKYL